MKLASAGTDRPYKGVSRVQQPAEKQAVRALGLVTLRRLRLFLYGPAPGPRPRSACSAERSSSWPAWSSSRPTAAGIRGDLTSGAPPVIGGRLYRAGFPSVRSDRTFPLHNFRTADSSASQRERLSTRVAASRPGHPRIADAFSPNPSGLAAREPAVRTESFSLTKYLSLRAKRTCTMQATPRNRQPDTQEASPLAAGLRAVSSEKPASQRYFSMTLRLSLGG
jgi:hypothetical protein